MRKEIKNMQNDLYTLAGTVNIPENRKKEFNTSVLELLYMGGIRKTETIKLNGKKFTVADRPRPNKNGIVQFNYSIFEQYERKINTYNTNTCKLDTPDRGYQEFGVIMNAVMIMQEAYSDGSCYYMDEGTLGKVDAYAALIKTLIGIDLNFSGRSRIWDMILFFHESKEYNDLTSDDVWEIYPWDYCDILKEHLSVLTYYDFDFTEFESKFEKIKKDDFAKTSKGKLIYYLYEKMTLLIKDNENENLKNYLKNLLALERKDRALLAAEDTIYGEIAEASLYLLPPLIIKAFAMASKQEFWESWDSIGIKGYSDVIINSAESDLKKDDHFISLYRAFQRENEDEFMEYWNDHELKFSNEMRKCFENWNKSFKQIIPDKDLNMESLLSEILSELEEYGKCRLPEKSFITEILEHKDDENYQKALLLYKKIVEVNLEDFPELTHRQAIRWILRGSMDKFFYTETAAFQALFINHKHRAEVLGF